MRVTVQCGQHRLGRRDWEDTYESQGEWEATIDEKRHYAEGPTQCPQCGEELLLVVYPEPTPEAADDYAEKLKPACSAHTRKWTIIVLVSLAYTAVGVFLLIRTSSLVAFPVVASGLAVLLFAPILFGVREWRSLHCLVCNPVYSREQQVKLAWLGAELETDTVFLGERSYKHGVFAVEGERRRRIDADVPAERHLLDFPPYVPPGNPPAPEPEEPTTGDTNEAKGPLG